MNDNIRVLDPIAPARLSGGGRLFRALPDLRGITVGFIDNSKPNFQALVEDLGELLGARYGVASIVKHRKRSASMPAAAEVIADVASRCDLVITGSGD